jgi:hypothetical protein
MPNKFFGKYRGTVINNHDPNGAGRIQVQIFDLPNAQIGWAVPCVPYNLPVELGSALPKVGTSVWVEFEKGDLNSPIWSGCFWSTADLPPALRNA